MRKYWAYFKISLADAFIYRAEGIIWMLNDIGPATIAIIFWLAAFSARSEVAGFTLGQMIVYYLGVMVVNCLVSLQPHYYLSEEIRSGVFSNYLIKPINLTVYKLATSTAWRTVRSLFFLPVLLVGIKVLAPDFAANLTLANIGLVILSLALTFWLNFFLKMVMALTTVWLTEAAWMFFSFDIFAGLLSGEIIPLDLFPSALNQINDLLPFKYLLYFPLSLFLGKTAHPQEIVRGLAISFFWLVFFYWLYRRLKHNSAKAYGAFGG